MKKLILILITLSVISCKTSPEAAGINEDEINAEAAKAYAEVISKSKISNNQAWTAIVNRVAQRIAKASGKPYNWEVVLIESKEVNAWCMPGGKMAVYTGIMPVVKTEAALAAVMGHEVAHATLKHGLQRYARAQSNNMIVAGAAVLTSVAAQALCKTENCKRYAAVGGLATALGVAFFDRKFSRGDETGADQEGQIYMARAGYDPAEAIKLWERMNAAGGGGGPEFMSTHPADTTRRGNLTAWLPEAQRVYNAAPEKLGLGATIK
jgi:metalloendopeptidase OMA1, mitochondrial